MTNYILTGFAVVCFLSLFQQGKELKEQIDELNAKLTVQYYELQEMKNESGR